MVDLPRGTATWVLTAHALTIASPLVVVWAVLEHRPQLDDILFSPELLLGAAGLQVLGSLFESAQNHRDDWYLTHNDSTLLDGAFNTCIVSSLALTALACQGQAGWLWPLALGAAVAYAAMYALDWPKESMQGVVGLLSTLCLYLSFRDPVVVLPLLTVFLTLYFLNLLLKTHAQSLHGFTTVVNAVGLMAIPWAILNHVRGAVTGWGTVAAIFVVVIGLALVLRPRLAQLAATPRRS